MVRQIYTIKQPPIFIHSNPVLDTRNVQNAADISIYNECEHDVEIDPDIFYDVSTPELDIESDKDESDNESALQYKTCKIMKIIYICIYP